MRKEILEKLAKLWEKYPNQRLGQLLENYVFGHHLETGGCIFHVYDETTLLALNGALKEFEEWERKGKDKEARRE